MSAQRSEYKQLWTVELSPLKDDTAKLECRHWIVKGCFFNLTNKLEGEKLAEARTMRFQMADGKDSASVNLVKALTESSYRM